MAYLAVILSIFVLLVSSGYGKVPRLEVGGVYHGTVSEQGGKVDLVPQLQAAGGPICGYRIDSSHHGKLPFEVFMQDQETGLADLRVRRPLDCETTESYVMDIVAVSCSGQFSPSAEVHVTVKDVNEFLPEWKETEYSAQIPEGELSDNIITLKASDRDCSPSFGSVCGYVITSPDQPFAINEKGVIRNTVPLSAKESRRHVLSVVARDCGGKESSPVLVTISVLPKCITSWTDVSTSMTYIPGTGPQPVFPQAKFQQCPSSVCTATKLETSLTLHTDHVGVGCDRDTYTLDSQRKMCGASMSAVDLLPVETEASWVADLKTDKGPEVNPVYKFDGATAVKIPEDVLSHNLGNEYTVSTWMRHQAKGFDKHAKEHILCLADDHRKNRHHLSLFVRNCKLVLLSRREYVEEERNIFKPAEWRWSLPQVCDDKWHHYAISFSRGTVELTLDGELWQPQPNNPEMIDDWPLHPAADLKTTMTVGGCWHGSDMKMRHILQGYLAGLSVLPGKKEHAEVLKCLVQCSESLQLPATNLLDPGMEMITNSHGSQVTIDGKDAKNMEELVRQVAYLNTREFPAPGRRRLELSTTITCSDGTKRDVPVSVSRILVLPVPQPTISLSASKNISKNYLEFKAGVRVFSDLKISVSHSDDYYDAAGAGPDTRLDKCTISVFPPLNPDHEQIILPQLMLKTLNIAGSTAETGAEIRGADMIYNYVQVLRQVIYSNQKPAYYLNRQFKLICSDLNERFSSNEYLQTVTVIHPPVVEEVSADQPAAHRQISAHGVELSSPRFISAREYLSLTGQAQGHAVVVVVAVCICLLVAVLAVGVVRLRTAHKRASEEEAEVEMAWDDTALNITVNPLEESECGGGPRLQRPVDSELEDSSDEDMYGEDSSEDEDEDDGVEESGTRHRLEWDNDL